MRIQSVSFGSVVLSIALLTGCATTSKTNGSRERLPSGHRTAAFKVRDPLVRGEIATELAKIEIVEPTQEEPQETPLKGPLTLERVAEIEKAQLGRPTILADMLAAKKLGDIQATASSAPPEPPPVQLKTLSSLETSNLDVSLSSNETPFIFDMPVTYNDRVSSWIRYFQTDGSKSFKVWLERSSRYVPVIEDELQKAGLPQDLVYLAMIESGFRPDAASHMGAIGLWQFIASTGRHYGLHIDWWIDERRDFAKSTKAAIAYMQSLNSEFDSWYLVAASYNMGESGVRRLIKRHATNNFWQLANLRALPRETADYVPKIIAATLIAKAPALYGFRDLEYQVPLAFDTVTVPGGTDLINLASYLGVSRKYLLELNPELTRGFIPREVKGHQIRVPKGSTLMVSQFTRLNGWQQQQPSDVTQEAAN